MLLRDQHRRGFDLVGDVQRVFVEAQEKVGACLAAAQELIRIGGIDANLVALLLQRPHGLFQMREGSIGQAAEIDDIGAFAHIILGALEDCIDGHGRGIDNLGEDLDVVFGHVRRLARAAEIAGDVLELVGAAHEGHAEALAQAAEIGAAAARQHDLVCLDRLRQTPRDDLFGHQRGDLHPDVEHLPGEARLHAFEHGLEPRPREVSGEEEDAFSHRRCLAVCVTRLLPRSWRERETRPSVIPAKAGIQHAERASKKTGPRLSPG